MDDRRFDQMTRSLVGATNRRDFMRRLLGVAGASGVAVVLGGRGAEAARRGYSGPSTPPTLPGPCRDLGTYCVANAQCCDGFCVPNIGPGGTCGICDATICGDFSCVDLKWDPRNCGSCGHECGSGATCNEGVCQGSV
jgi:hypothetical protein